MWRTVESDKGEHLSLRFLRLIGATECGETAVRICVEKQRHNDGLEVKLVIFWPRHRRIFMGRKNMAKKR